MRTSLHEVVLDYDETVSRAQAEMLLLNIARARHHRPVHFTTVSGIAATFDFRTDVGMGAELAEGPAADLYMPSVGVSAAENPTISIVPIQGEEFTRRLLTPLDESTFGFFYHQGVDAALLLELIVRSIVVETPDGDRRVIDNGADGFAEIVSRIDALDRARRLDVGELVFEESWRGAADGAPSAKDLAELIELGYGFRMDGGEGVLSRRVVGRHAVTSYDPAAMSNDARIELQRAAQEYPSNFVRLDLRRGGAAAPLRGWIKLRSVSAILDSIATGIRESRPDALPRVVEAEAPHGNSLFTVEYEGLHYALPRDPEARSQTAFRVLYRLYQMSVSDVPATAVPPVTIAK